ncbi:hypothetical protein SR39_31165 [Methylobacterium radiotolerans]|nr:hypothetical protein SR39_31165 [Methylobacterium radiotolerans]
MCRCDQIGDAAPEIRSVVAVGRITATASDTPTSQDETAYNIEFVLLLRGNAFVVEETTAYIVE